MVKKKPSGLKGKISGQENAQAALRVIKEKSFPIVAIGASSGGLEAVTELLKYLPANTGMAFIFIQHLNPDYKSILVSLLSKATKMKVQEIEDMEHMKPDNIYVIPYNKGIEVTDGHIQLIPRPKSSPNLTIDVLFTSLAETHQEEAIGVILSGNASDGTMGLKAIQQAGGITFAQDSSAKYGSMPESAINEGAADFILSPRKIAMELSRISKHTFERKKILQGRKEDKSDDNAADLKIILEILHKKTGVDFSNYKMGTINRRILRRMFLYKLKTLKQYAALLKTQSKEPTLLHNDLLIHVTSFFRDAEAFQYLKTTLFPKLFKNKPSGEKLRIWVTACSTGQEAYSMAMLLIEMLGNKISGKQVQIFASDLSEQAIKKARAGEYSTYEMKGISPKRIEHFFTKIEGGNYRIAKAVRDLCAFAPHNVLSDPPFSRIDFISCCNLLIYLDIAVHKKAFTTFHYALNDGGCLMLGKAETTGSSQFFSAINGKFKIYSRKKGLRTLPDLISRAPHAAVAKAEALSGKKAINGSRAATDTVINSILFSRYIPSYVVINHAMEILQFKGATADYLTHATGKATLNIVHMARPEIAFELREAIHKAVETKREIHKTGIEIRNGNVLYAITLDIIPLITDGEEPLLLVVFAKQEQPETHEYNFKPGKNGTTGNIEKLKAQLAATRADLIAVSEEKEKSNKILQAASEEILASNEEFQSMNEELETSKEEIECANEELITTNHELQMRNTQLAEASGFLEAIVTTLHEPILILDKNLRVKSANKAFCKKFQVLQEETEGRLLYELGNHQWNIPALRKLLETIIKKDTYFYDYEITHVFPVIGKKTMLLNAMRMVQKVQNEELILLAFTDATERTLERKAEKKVLEGIISERTAALEQSYNTLEEKNVALEKMNKELETFTFISSHDLQEPLRKITNFAACLLVEEQKNLSGSGKDYLHRMQQTVMRMKMLIEDLLAYSQTKTTGHHFENTDMNEVAEEVIAELKENLEEKKAVVKASGLCHLSIIRFQFRQLLHNLISNSLKFSNPERRPHIVIKSEKMPGKKLHNSSLLPETNYCHITITDNGIGFDPQYKDRIFEVFQRLHGHDTYKGTGMGLAICKRIVENHNGTITATGSLNKGARFNIYIPVAE